MQSTPNSRSVWPQHPTPRASGPESAGKTPKINKRKWSPTCLLAEGGHSSYAFNLLVYRNKIGCGQQPHSQYVNRWNPRAPAPPRSLRPHSVAAPKNKRFARAPRSPVLTASPHHRPRPRPRPLRRPPPRPLRFPRPRPMSLPWGSLTSSYSTSERLFSNLMSSAI